MYYIPNFIFSMLIFFDRFHEARSLGVGEVNIKKKRNFSLNNIRIERKPSDSENQI